jgi:threonine 3-dehydrogenase
MKKVLVTGATGQIGSELVLELRRILGKDSVIASGRATRPANNLRESGPFVYLDVLDRSNLERVIMEYDIDTIFHLSAMLSAKGEKNPQLAYEVNVNGTFKVLEAARQLKVKKVVVPSSIAAFGPDTPRVNTPNDCVMRPTTMYGIGKVAAELLGEYYYIKYGLDVRMLRYPGIISSETAPGGGTTDYAVDMYIYALSGKEYDCFVSEDTILPFMYMPDAIKSIIDLAESDNENLKHRVYNVAGFSASAGEIAESIRKVMPDFKCNYKPDYRQQIADSWPQSLDDTVANEEWGWKPEYDLDKTTEDMIEKLSKTVVC